MSEAKTNAWQKFETNQGQPQTYGDPYGPPTYDEWAANNPPLPWWQTGLNLIPDIIGLFQKPETPPAPAPGPVIPQVPQPSNQILNLGILVIFGVIAYYLIKKIK
jgi:hypothetical protein